MEGIINKTVRQCGLRWSATLLCKLMDCEYPFTGGASYVLGYVIYGPVQSVYPVHQGMTAHGGRA
jgi:hypothetical protein